MIVIGLSGATCSGKTTVCDILKKIFTNIRVFNQDFYYWTDESPKHKIEDKTGFINWEILSSFDMDHLHSDLKSHLDNAQRHCKLDAHHRWTVDNTFKNRDAFDVKIDPGRFESVDVVVVEGILVLNDPRIADLCHHKFFFELNKETCWERRQGRTYDPEDQIGYFENLAWPYYLSNLEDLKASGQNIRWLRGEVSIQQNLVNVMNHISDHPIS